MVLQAEAVSVNAMRQARDKPVHAIWYHTAAQRQQERWQHNTPKQTPAVSTRKPGWCSGDQTQGTADGLL